MPNIQGCLVGWLPRVLRLQDLQLWLVDWFSTSAVRTLFHLWVYKNFSECWVNARVVSIVCSSGSTCNNPFNAKRERWMASLLPCSTSKNSERKHSPLVPLLFTFCRNRAGTWGSETVCCGLAQGRVSRCARCLTVCNMQQIMNTILVKCLGKNPFPDTTNTWV